MGILNLEDVIVAVAKSQILPKIIRYLNGLFGHLFLDISVGDPENQLEISSFVFSTHRLVVQKRVP